MRATKALLALLVAAAPAAAEPNSSASDAAKVLGAATVFAPPAPPRALVELGRRLYFDPALSAARDRSCATCHDPGKFWAAGARSVGARHAPSLLDSSRPGAFFRDGRAPTLEDAVLSELRDPRVMGLDERAFASRVDGFPEGPALVEPAGPAGSDAERAARALAAFLRVAARHGESPFDRAASGAAPLPDAAAAGLALFVGKARCAGCHSGPWLSDGHYYRVGLRDGDPVDPGRAAVTPVRQMRGAFRTAPLRDCARTGPYMHDGSLKTLREVVEFYDRGGDESLRLSHDIAPIGLTSVEKADLVAFLESLTGEPVPVARPAAPTPRVRTADGALDDARRRRAQARRAWSARDAAALRDAADGWASSLAAARAGRAGDASSCLTNAASAAGDLAEMAFTGRSWPILGERLELAAEWTRECGFLAARAAGRAVVEEEIEPEAPLPRAAALLDRAAAIAAARREGRGDGPRAAACRNALTDRELLARLKERPWDDDAEQNVTKQTVVYRSYQAVRAGDARRCDDLAIVSMAVGVARSGAERCRELYTDLAAAKALFARDPSYVALCRDNAAISYPGIPAGDAEAACRTILAGVDDPLLLCERLSPAFVPPSLRGACVARFRLFSPGATAEECRVLEAGPSIIHDQCLDMAAYAAARGAGDPAKCGSSAFCRLLMGAGAEDEKAQWASLRDLACRAPAAPASLARYNAVLDEASALLSRAESGRSAGERAEGPGIDALEERAARLRLEAGGLFSGPLFPSSPY